MNSSSQHRHDTSLPTQGAKLDVFFRARYYLPQWLVYGTGALLGGWLFVLMALWTWQWCTQDGASVVRHVLWLVLPICWALLFVFCTQLSFGVSEMLARVLRLNRNARPGIAVGLNVAAIIGVAWWQTTSMDCWFQRSLGWFGLASVFVVAVVEAVTRMLAAREKILDIKKKVP